MNALWFRPAVGFLVLLSLASLGAEPLKREPLRPFSEFENLLLRGALIVASIVAAWFVLVLIRGVLQDRRQVKQAKDQPAPEVVPSAATKTPGAHGL